MQQVIRRHTIEQVELSNSIEDGFFSKQDAYYDIVLSDSEGKIVYKKNFPTFDKSAMQAVIKVLIPMLEEEGCIDIYINEGGYYSEQIFTLVNIDGVIMTCSDEPDKPDNLVYTQE